MPITNPLLPSSPQAKIPPRLHPRVIVLGVILTIILAAANAYLGLKVGTNRLSIHPRQRLSRWASCASFVIPIFLKIRWCKPWLRWVRHSQPESHLFCQRSLLCGAWTEFDYWQTVFAGLLGGGLGVLFTIPLRRALFVIKLCVIRRHCNW